MGQLAADTFARSNQSGWNTASDGVSVWSHPVGAGTLSILANDGVVTYGSGVTNVMLCGTGTSLPTEGRGRFQCSDATLSTAGVVLRSNAGGTTYYGCAYKFASQKLVLTRVVAGVPSVLAQSAVFAADTIHAYRLRFRVTGVAPVRLSGRIWLDGTTESIGWSVTGIDSSASKITTAGQFGLSALPGIAGSTVLFDSFSFGDMNLGTYHDYTTLQARVLTPQEYANLGGMITTRSGSSPFVAEDFLCKNFSGQWVMSHAAFTALDMERISDPDGQQFYVYGKLGAARTVTITDQGDGTTLCSDGTIADNATLASAYVV